MSAVFHLSLSVWANVFTINLPLNWVIQPQSLLKTPFFLWTRVYRLGVLHRGLVRVLVPSCSLVCGYRPRKWGNSRGRGLPELVCPSKRGPGQPRVSVGTYFPLGGRPPAALVAVAIARPPACWFGCQSLRLCRLLPAGPAVGGRGVHCGDAAPEAVHAPRSQLRTHCETDPTVALPTAAWL